MRLPDGIIAGAPRSGTTKVYSFLRDHPRVFAATGKELHFFDEHWARGVAWYSEHFEAAPVGHFTIESTPLYLSNSDAMGRLSKTLPTVKLLAILRNPTERAHSHFHYRVARGLDAGTLEDAITRELAGDPSAFPYLRIGCYGAQLRTVRELPLERELAVLWYDDLVAESEQFKLELLSSLGLEDCGRDLGPERVNSADRFRSRRLRNAAKRLPAPAHKMIGRLNRRTVDHPPIERATGLRMLDFFEADIRDLEQTTGRNLAMWLDENQFDTPYWAG